MIKNQQSTGLANKWIWTNETVSRASGRTYTTRNDWRNTVHIFAVTEEFRKQTLDWNFVCTSFDTEPIWAGFIPFMQIRGDEKIECLSLKKIELRRFIASRFVNSLLWARFRFYFNFNAAVFDLGRQKSSERCNEGLRSCIVVMFKLNKLLRGAVTMLGRKALVASGLTHILLKRGSWVQTWFGITLFFNSRTKQFWNFPWVKYPPKKFNGVSQFVLDLH